jgi:hypothetical protein
MTVLKVLATLPLWFLIVAADTPSSSPSASPTPTSAASDSPSPSPAPSPTPPPAASPSPSPSPTPTPVNAYLTLDVSAGGANTAITVSGNSFLPGEQMSLFWDAPNKVIGSATADGNGNFSGVKVKPFAGDPPGLHKICASVLPNPCAQFELQSAPTPTPSAPASPSESPSPEASASPTESPTPTPLALPAAADTNNLDVLFHPPFIFLPFIAALGLVGAIAYWVFGTIARRPRVLPSASIVHRSVRPEAGVPGIEFVPPSAPAPAPPPPLETDWQPPWPAPNPPIEDPPESGQPRD